MAKWGPEVRKTSGWRCTVRDSLKTETAKICGKVHSKVLGRVPMLSSDSQRDAWPPNRRAHGLVTLSAFHFGAMVGGHK